MFKSGDQVKIKPEWSSSLQESEVVFTIIEWNIDRGLIMDPQSLMAIKPLDLVRSEHIYKID